MKKTVSEGRTEASEGERMKEWREKLMISDSEDEKVRERGRIEASEVEGMKEWREKNKN